MRACVRACRGGTLRRKDESGLHERLSRAKPFCTFYPHEDSAQPTRALHSSLPHARSPRVLSTIRETFAQPTSTSLTPLARMVGFAIGKENNKGGQMRRIILNNSAAEGCKGSASSVCAALDDAGLEVSTDSTDTSGLPGVGNTPSARIRAAS